jgi:hypothetical protein
VDFAVGGSFIERGVKIPSHTIPSRTETPDPIGPAPNPTQPKLNPSNDKRQNHRLAILYN